MKNLCSEKEIRGKSDILIQLADKTIHAADQKLWSKQDGCYIDIQESATIDEPYKLLTQDVSLYLVAITENTANDNLRIQHHNKKQQQEPKTIHLDLHNKAISTLNALRKRVWKEKWQLITERELKKTAPWI